MTTEAELVTAMAKLEAARAGFGRSGVMAG
jgi:hypothetical protein